MSKILAVLSIILLPALLAADRRNVPQPRSLVFTEVTVIDATGAPAKPDMTVVIIGDRINTLGKSGKVKIPTGARVVNGMGKYLIPGLWDMHVHTGQKEIFFPLYIANGVTGVRDMGGDQDEPTGNLSIRFDLLRQWRKEVNEGTLLGPRMVIAGLMVDGPRPAWPGAVAVGNAVEARKAVAALNGLPSP